MEDVEAKMLLLDKSCDNCVDKCLINDECLLTLKKRPKSNVCSKHSFSDYQDQFNRNMTVPSIYEEFELANETLKEDVAVLRGDWNRVMNSSSVQDTLDAVRDSVEDITEKVRRRY